jgi:NAD(P)H-nitrite reductase large subunit
MFEMKVLIVGNGIAGFSADSTIQHLDDHYKVTNDSDGNGPALLRLFIDGLYLRRNSRDRVFVKSEKDYVDLGIHMLSGREVKDVGIPSPKVVLDDGEGHSFDKLILATGSDAVVFGDVKKRLFKSLFKTEGTNE